MSAWRDWKCVACDAVNNALRVRCRLCWSNRATFHPDPDIDDECWRDHWKAVDLDVKAGLEPEVLR